MDAKWAQIQKLRRENLADTDGIRRLLDELETEGDVDAEIQKFIVALETRILKGELNHCQAFAEGMGRLATAVEGQPLPNGMRHGPGSWSMERRGQFLQLAWAYFVSHDDHLNHGWVSGQAGHREPLGGYHAPDWATTHTDGRIGSGYMSPRADDADEDRGGRKAHFIANALVTFRHFLLGDAARATWNLKETSSTDVDVNRIGSEFGHMIALKKLDHDNMADWIRKNLCTEGKCSPGSVDTELIRKLRWAILSGTFQGRYEERNGKRDPSRDPFPKESETHYTWNEKLTFSFRASYKDGHDCARFGRVLASTWEPSHQYEVVTDGQPESHSLSGLGHFTRLEGAMLVDGDGASSANVTGFSGGEPGYYLINFQGFEVSEEDRTRLEEQFHGYDPRRGRPEGQICSDGSLSGSGSYEEGSNAWVPYEVIANMFALEDDTTRTVFGKLHRKANWSWSIQIAPAEPPEHAQSCEKTYSEEEVSNVIKGFVRQARSELDHVYGDLCRTGRVSEAQEVGTISGGMMLLDLQFGDEKDKLRALESILGSGCHHLDELWLSDDPLADSNYDRELNDYRENVAKWDNQKQTIAAQLSGKIKDIAAQVRAFDRVAAGNLERMASEFDRDGF